MNDLDQFQLDDINFVKRQTGYKSTTSIYTLMREQGFPKPVSCGARTKRWIHSEVQAWLKKQIETTRGAA